MWTFTKISTFFHHFSLISGHQQNFKVQKFTFQSGRPDKQMWTQKWGRVGKIIKVSGMSKFRADKCQKMCLFIALWDDTATLEIWVSKRFECVIIVRYFGENFNCFLVEWADFRWLGYISEILKYGIFVRPHLDWRKIYQKSHLVLGQFLEIFHRLRFAPARENFQKLASDSGDF